MTSTLRKIVTVLAILLIVGAIWYFESSKPASIPPGSRDIVITDETPGVASTTSTASTAVADRSSIRGKKASTLPRVKELTNIRGYINVPAEPVFMLANIVGKKVILVDFWTYSCINCQRTTPYLNAWYEKYKNFGLEIVGVHTPEFDFEKNYDNVSKATAEAGIKYPVVLDSDYGTWLAYQNRYWPRKYLVDIDGFIVYDHAGEGAYQETETKIQNALRERAEALGLTLNIPTGFVNPDAPIPNPSQVGSPEIYFGAARNENLANGTPGRVGRQTFASPNSPKLNGLYLVGDWNLTNEYAENLNSSSKIVFKYNAKDVYFVASSKEGVTAKVFVDGSLSQTIQIKENKLYTLVSGEDYGTHTLEIEIQNPGLQAFTFTFG